MSIIKLTTTLKIYNYNLQINFIKLMNYLKKNEIVEKMMMPGKKGYTFYNFLPCQAKQKIAATKMKFK